MSRHTRVDTTSYKTPRTYIFLVTPEITTIPQRVFTPTRSLGGTVTLFLTAIVIIAIPFYFVWIPAFAPPTYQDIIFSAKPHQRLSFPSTTFNITVHFGVVFVGNCNEETLQFQDVDATFSCVQNSSLVHGNSIQYLPSSVASGSFQIPMLFKLKNFPVITITSKLPVVEWSFAADIMTFKDNVYESVPLESIRTVPEARIYTRFEREKYFTETEFLVAFSQFNHFSTFFCGNSFYLSPVLITMKPIAVCSSYLFSDYVPNFADTMWLDSSSYSLEIQTDPSNILVPSNLTWQLQMDTSNSISCGIVAGTSIGTILSFVAFTAAILNSRGALRNLLIRIWDSTLCARCNKSRKDKKKKLENIELLSDYDE